MKTCRDRGEEKPREDFSPAKKARDGRTSYCRAWLRVRHQRYRDARNGRTTRLYGDTREYHLRRLYGITGAEVQATVEAQADCAPSATSARPSTWTTTT